MVLAKLLPRIRRALSLLILAAVLGAGSLTLMQCRMVGDKLTGVQVDVLHNRGSRDCIKECKKDRDLAIVREVWRHWVNVHQCRHDRNCLEQEWRRFLEALAQIERDYRNCLNNCHDQGGGGDH